MTDWSQGYLKKKKKKKKLIGSESRPYQDSNWMQGRRVHCKRTMGATVISFFFETMVEERAIRIIIPLSFRDLSLGGLKCRFRSLDRCCCVYTC